MHRLIHVLVITMVMSLGASAWAQKAADKAKPAKPGKAARPAKAAQPKEKAPKVAPGKPGEAKTKKMPLEKEKKKEKPKLGTARDAVGAQVKPLTGAEKHKAVKVRAERLRRARGERKKAARNNTRKKVKAALKGKPMTKALKQELERHARRIARLERIMELAAEHADDESLTRAEKLLARENIRHTKWMKTFAANPGKGAGK